MSLQVKDSYSETERQEIANKLRLRKELLLSTERQIENLELGRDLRGEPSVQVGRYQDDSDYGAEEAIIEVCADMARRQIREIQLIEDALFRLERGQYGYCEGCEEQISLRRIEALPYARTCLSCEKAAEAEGRRKLGPLFRRGA